MNRFKWTIIGVAVLVVAGIIFMGIPTNDDPVDNGTEPPNGKNDIGVVNPDPPPPVNDPVRIREVYAEGKTYRRTLDYGVEAIGQHQMWGLGVDYTILYAGRIVVDTKIEENDGENIVAVVTVRDAKTENARKQFDGARINLGKRAHILLGLIGMIEGIPPGISVVTEEALNAFLDTPEAREIIEMWPMQAFQVEAIDGYTFRIHFTDGKGVTNIAMLQAPENREFGGQAPFIDEVAMREFAQNYNPIWDAAVFPNEEVAVGESWQVSGHSFPNMFPPSMFVRITDAITVRRDKDSNGQAVLTVPEHGSLGFRARPKGKQVSARLSLAGDMKYDLVNRMFSSAKFDGELPMEDMSTNHILFPSTHRIRPAFHVHYTCEVLNP